MNALSGIAAWLWAFLGVEQIPAGPSRSSHWTRRYLWLDQLEVKETPAGIEITEIPTYGVDGFLRGTVTGVDPGLYRVAVYIQIEGLGWYTKPTFANPSVPINASGTFEADVATGGIDNRATVFCAALVAVGQPPPLANGAGRVPAGLNATAIDFEERFGRTIQFAGHNWGIKEAPVPVGPGGNRFSYQPGDVFVDSNGLHMSLHFHNGFWWSTEVVLLDRLGQGTYTFRTQTDVSNLDAKVVFGAFTWDLYGDDESGANAHREIDFEASRWGNASDPTNAQEVVQPFDVAGNLHRFTIPTPAGDPALTWALGWKSDRIDFLTLQGEHTATSYPPGSVIDAFHYLHNPAISHFVPTEGRETFRFNVWLNSNASAPDNGQPVDIVISDFTFTPPPRVTSVKVNDGSSQRSRVTSMTVGFDQPVTLPPQPAGAFELRRTSDNALVGLSATVAGATATNVTLTFTGSATESGSLADGPYMLTVLSNQVANFNGSLDGNADGIGGDNFITPATGPGSIHRLFGDADGDRDVDVFDFLPFRGAFGGNTNLAFDSDGDGDVDAADFGQFRRRFGTSI